MPRNAPLVFMRQLCHLRWLAVIFQALTLTLVAGPMGVALPVLPLAAGTATLAAFNIYVAWRLRQDADGHDHEVFAHLLIDIAVLAWLITLGGGMENPFASLFLLPIALAILALPRGLMIATAVASVAGYGFSTRFGNPLPAVPGFAGGAYGLHMAGMLADFIVSAVVMLLFFTRMAAAWRRSEQEVSRLRDRFTRNEGIVALATHAAAVAHELNTPLATLTLMIEEMAEDAHTPAQRQQAATFKSLIDLCRDRVRTLAAPASADTAPLMTALDDVIGQWQLVRPTINLQRSGNVAGITRVDPAVGHLLQALLNNAADASEQAGQQQVDLRLESDARGLHCLIRDYGVGFDLAQPPLPAELFRSGKSGGLGLGLALSHATVERLGGQLSMQATGGRGVRVEFHLPPARGLLVAQP